MKETSRQSSISKKSKSYSEERKPKPEHYYRKNDKRSVESSRSNDSKKHYSNRNQSNSHERKKDVKLPILIIIDYDFYEELQKDNFTLLDKLKTNYKVEKVVIDDEIQIPELNGKILHINSSNSDDKYEAAEYFVDKYMKFIDIDGNSSSQSLKILMPEIIVSLFIGAKGKQIKQLMYDSRTKLTVSQPGQPASHRMLTIEGEPYYLKKSLRIISNSIERLSFDKHIHSQDNNSKPYDNKNTRVVAKLILDDGIVSHLYNRRDNIIRNICRENSVGIKVVDPPRYLHVKREDRLCVRLKVNNWKFT